MNDIKVKIFAIAKDEGAYIPQWVFHHFYFGFDEIEIWLNNIEDNSVEVCEKLANVYPKFKYEVADNLLEECKKNNKHFQREAYNIIFERELSLGEFTHIMFLDLDEFWTPKDFKTRIRSLLNTLPEADTVSFLWYLDEANLHSKPFSNTFHKYQYLEQFNHVKTLTKISNNIQKVDIHNTLFKGGAIQLFCDGSVFDTKNQKSLEGAIVVDLPIHRKNLVDSYFIYHRVFKSQEEYVSSLLRGRQHVKDNKDILKSNRWGYYNINSLIKYDINQELLDKYYHYYDNFLTYIDLAFYINISRKFILTRFEKVESVYHNNFDFYSQKDMFKGLKLPNFKIIDVLDFKYCIDKVILSERNIVTIVGWALTKNTGLNLNVRIIDRNEQYLDGEFKRIDRPDVVRIVDNKAPLNCGFNFICQINDIKDTSKLKVSLDRFDKKTNTVIFNVEY